MASHLGWRNFWWLITGLNIFTILCCIFLFPETKFQRPFGYADNKTLKTTGTTTDSPTDKSSTEKVEGGLAGNQDTIDAESATAVQKTVTGATMDQTFTHQDPFLGRGKRKSTLTPAF
jgi:hypothetical protein